MPDACVVPLRSPLAAAVQMGQTVLPLGPSWAYASAAASVVRFPQDAADTSDGAVKLWNFWNFVAGYVSEMTTYKKRTSVVAIKRVISLPVLILWMSISLMVSLLCCWSYSHPAWTVRSSQVTHPPVARSERTRTIRSAISVQPDLETDVEYAVSPPAAPVTRNTIPLVHIGLYSMCIYSHRDKLNAATCVSHAELDYEWLPPAWQVIDRPANQLITSRVH